MTLRELIDRLSTRSVVDGLAVISSGADGTMNDVSDCDLLIVLNDPPLRIVGGVTQADDRMVDLIFSTTTEIDELLGTNGGEVEVDGISGTIVRWMKSARTEIDRNGRLQRLQGKARSGPKPFPYGEGHLKSRLDKASYNLAHTRR